MNNEQITSETTKKINDKFLISCGFVAASGICFVFEKYCYVFGFFDFSYVFGLFGFIFLIISIAVFLFYIRSLFKNSKEPETMNTLKKSVALYIILVFVMYIISSSYLQHM